ncbi:hypothetical protein [Ignavibacterium sp.]|uniref:hypothetical protein n=1 Tax=Ignavibacterium sp. TaxID=2651167 RepID=UPI00307F1E1A
MKDHNLFDAEKKRISIFIVEIKRGVCNLNGPWTNKERENINRVLKSIGAFLNDNVNAVAMDLYDKARYEDENFIVQLAAVGCRINNKLKEKYQNLHQLTFNEDILPFIYYRLKEYERQKADHQQWDETGQVLYKNMMTKNKGEFIASIISDSLDS